MGWDPYEEDPGSLEPDGVESLVGCVIRHDEYSYYVAPRWLWFLDYYKYCLAAYPGYTRGTKDSDLESRFNIYTVDAEHEEAYFHGMDAYRRSFKRMQDDMKMCLDMFERYDYWPVFLIDFDKRVFLSRFREPYEPERWLPDGWIGRWEDFPNELIPEEYRFWIDENGVNLWEVFEE